MTEHGTPEPGTQTLLLPGLLTLSAFALHAAAANTPGLISEGVQCSDI